MRKLCEFCKVKPVARTRTKFCSKKCYLENQKQKLCKKTNKKYTILTNCKNCGKSISSPKRTFCSSECNQEFHQKQYKLKNKPRTKKRCLWCKKEYLTFMSRQKYCDRTCTHNYIKIQKRIFRLFEEPEQTEQLNRLEKLGKNYTFPLRFQVENIFYQLTGLEVTAKNE